MRLPRQILVLGADSPEVWQAVIWSQLPPAQRAEIERQIGSYSWGEVPDAIGWPQGADDSNIWALGWGETELGQIRREHDE